MKARYRGFTLIEMLVAIAVLAVLMAIAIPSFDGLSLSGTLRSIASDIVADVHLARSEALKRRTAVVLCASSDGASCTGTWSGGWIVACRTSDSVNCAAGGSTWLVLQRHAAPRSGYVVSAGAASSVTFTSTGLLATGSVFTICRNQPTVATQQRQLTIAATGRISIAETSGSTCS